MKEKESYLSISIFVKEAKKLGVNFGQTSPYNRLRYYTKLGLLPNMLRIKGVGNYPKGALEKLVRIEEYKKLGWDNKKILRAFSKEDVVIKLDPKSRIHWLKYISWGAVIFFFSVAIFITNMQLRKNIPTIGNLPEKNTGTHQIFPGSDKSFVFDNRVAKNSRVFVTFVSNYTPATSFYISNISPNLGFEISLSYPTKQTATFNYWIL